MAWGFMAPAVVSILIWNYYPLVRGALLAFTDYRILGASRLVGLDNFIAITTQKTFWRALGQTCVYAGLSLGLGFPVPIVLALLLSEIPRAKLLFRTVFYLPAVTSGLVVMFVWKMMYDDSVNGVLNQALFWMTTRPSGRATVAGLLAGTWLLVVAVLASVLWRALQRQGRPGTGLGRAALLLAVPVWVDCATEVAAWALAVAGLPLPAWLGALHPLTTYLRASGLRTPLAVAGLAGIRAVGLMLTLAGGSPAAADRWTQRRASAAVLGCALMTASLIVSTSALLRPMERAYPWLQDPRGYWAMLWVVFPGIWAGAGPGCIIYLAAIKSIPQEMYDAADVDGAGPLDKVLHVTLRFLKPLIIINFVGAFVGTFHAMQNILVMTGGGPGYRTMTIGMDIFFNAFTHLRFGYATAEAWVLGSLLIGFTVYQLRILKHLRFTRAGQAQ